MAFSNALLNDEESAYLRKLLEDRKAHVAEVMIGVYADLGTREAEQIDGILGKL